MLVDNILTNESTTEYVMPSTVAENDLSKI